MIDYESYIENPEKITKDIILEARQDRKDFLADLLLRRYHKFLINQRIMDLKRLKAESL